MESSPRNQIPPTGENSFTCSLLKESILHPSSRKWCSGLPHTRIPKTKPLSGKSRKTRSNSWLPCDNAGPERPSHPPERLRWPHLFSFTAGSYLAARNKVGSRQRTSLPVRQAAQTALVRRSGDGKAVAREGRRVPRRLRLCPGHHADSWGPRCQGRCADCRQKNQQQGFGRAGPPCRARRFEQNPDHLRKRK